MLLCGSVFYSFLFSKNIPLYEFTIIAYLSLLLDFLFDVGEKTWPSYSILFESSGPFSFKKRLVKTHSIYCIRAITILQLSDGAQHPKYTLFRGGFGHEIYE